MSSLPTSYLSPSRPPERTHKHRRSAAISGDFDAYGLGLFSPSNKSINQVIDDDLDMKYNFNNDDDFKNGPDFLFPNNIANPSAKFTECDSLNVSSPQRYMKKHLNSPIKLNNRRSFSQPSLLLQPPQLYLTSFNPSSPLNSQIHNSNQNTPNTKFFLTEETNINNDNVPDAVIDLDEVLNANLHIGEFGNKKDDFFGDDFLSSPFEKNNSSYMNSPYMNPTPLLQQPIQETNDDLEVSDTETDIPSSNFKSNPLLESEDIFNPPTIISNEVYSNSSANSSTSSLKRQFIEKTHSNSSGNSNNSTVIQNQYLPGAVSFSNSSTSATPKRSGAMANRYQTFYNQSYKISNALKYSSSESVNSKPNSRPTSKTSSPQQSSSSLNIAQSYVYSYSSLPQESATPSGTSTPNGTPTTNQSSASLQQSNSVSYNQSMNSPSIQAINPKNCSSPRLLAHSSSLPSLKTRSTKLRYGNDIRYKYNPNKVTSNVNLGSGVENRLSPPPTLVTDNVSSSSKKTSLPKFVTKDNKMDIQTPRLNTSPISIVSDTNSTIISNISTVQSTDHSSLELKEKLIKKSSPPLITVTKGSNDPSPKRSPRRPLTPNEERILKQTIIPPFNKKISSDASIHSNGTRSSENSESSSKTYKDLFQHKHKGKSKSFSIGFNDLSPRVSNNLDDSSSIKSNKSNKIINWFKRK